MKGSVLKERPDREEAKPPKELAYLGEDATPDFFYAGRFATKNPNKEPGDDEPDSIDTYSYGTLPFGDCNPFVVSVWTYLSPRSD
jgi:hypothetical protein